MKKYPKASLGFFPTPVERLLSLSKYLGGPQISIKRDDQSGLALGGNKTRKLEYIIGDAIAQGADTVITAGASQSNHCRQTAAAAADARRLDSRAEWTTHEKRVDLIGPIPRTDRRLLLLLPLRRRVSTLPGSRLQGRSAVGICQAARNQGRGETVENRQDVVGVHLAIR